MSCGSPMPRGERIAKPAEWGTPIRPVFHSLRGEPNPEASMRTRFALVALAVALSTACAVVCVAVTGTIEIKAATSGADVDPDGYTVQVDGGTTAALAVSGTTRFEGLSAGSHTVTLAGAATNCPVAADNPRTVSVTTG